jgi:double-stranded uracil-DNA glycosylase
MVLVHVSSIRWMQTRRNRTVSRPRLRERGTRSSSEDEALSVVQLGSAEMVSKDDPAEVQPSVAAYLAEYDEYGNRFLLALGRAVLGAAALENALRLELAHLLLAAQASGEAIDGKELGEQMTELEILTAGQLLRRLRERGLPQDLERRIDDAVSRRNQLVHHLFEDPRLVRAATQVEAEDEGVAHLQALALDCAGLSLELQTFALLKIEALTGASKEELVSHVLSLDPAGIEGRGERERLEAIQSLGDAADWSGALERADWDHRITVDWLGEKVETLADLLRPGLRAVCVGINPSPVSVTAGHYYQGRIGRRLWQRLQQAGVIEAAGTGQEDGAAFLSGIGFTDIVKRPTPRADAISATEFEYGRKLLTERLRIYTPALLIFTFKKAATALFGRFEGHGYRPEFEFAGAKVFVMPGPYERSDHVAAALEELRELIAGADASGTDPL